jgi:hypothetical protein
MWARFRPVISHHGLSANERPCPLRHGQQGLPKPPKRGSLTSKTVNLSLDSRRQDCRRSVSAELAELVP